MAGCVGEFAQRFALHVVRLDRLLKLVDRTTSYFARRLTTKLLQRQVPALPPAGRVIKSVSCKILLTVRREDSRIDVPVAVAPEAGSVTENRVVVDIVKSERPEQRPDPAVAAINVPPPAARGAPVTPARQRGSRHDLAARHRFAEPIDRKSVV